MRKVLFILLTIVSSGLSAQQKIENVQCAVNAQGLITLQECPTEHPQLLVNINDACNHVTIYLNGQVFQELETDDEFISPTDDKSVHYLDANFDGHCDIFVGPGCSRTYSSLFIWNPKNGKYEEAIGDAPLQNFMIDPSSKLVYDGGSSSYCEEDAFKMKWTGNRLEKLEDLKEITDPKAYRENGVKYQYTVKNAQTGKLIKATNHKQNLPKSWQKYVKTMSW